MFIMNGILNILFLAVKEAFNAHNQLVEGFID
jgi:hypothetical protein